MPSHRFAPLRAPPIPAITVSEPMALSPSVDGRRSRWSGIALRVLAIVFSAATVLYTWFFIEATWHDRTPAGRTRLEYPYQPLQRAYVVTEIRPGSPAEKAGLRVGDAVIAFEGHRVENGYDQRRVYLRHAVGDSVRLTVLRPGQTAPFEVTAIFRPNSDLAPAPGSLQEAVNRLMVNFFPLAFAVVGLVILLLRPEDRNVWLLACFFAGIISAPGYPDDFQSVPAPLRPWLEVYKGTFFYGLVGASFYYLCAVFRCALHSTGACPGSNGLASSSAWCWSARCSSRIFRRPSLLLREFCPLAPPCGSHSEWQSDFSSSG